MQPMWLCILSSRPFEDAFENAHWRKVKQMQLVWLCIYSGRPFEDTFENTQWRKAKQMLPTWFCIFSSRPFEATFENAQWREKSNKCNQYNFASSRAGNLMRHLKMHSREKSINATNATRHFSKQAIWADIWKCTVKSNKCNQCHFSTLT